MKKSGCEECRLRIVLVGDVHMGPSNSTRPGEETPVLMQELVEKINSEIKPDLVIELGDRINNSNPLSDRDNAIRFASIISRLSMPYHLILGNHDIHHLTKKENEAIFGKPVLRRAESFKGFKLIFLDTEEPVIEGVGGSISDEQLQWLNFELNNDDLPKIVFGHHPIDEQDIGDNPHFLEFPPLAFTKNRDKVREILDSGKNVISYINGHVHWFSFCTGKSVPAISVPSFTEAWPEKSNAPGMFAEVSFTQSKDIQVAIRSIRPNRILGKFSWTVTESVPVR